ncbi:adenosylhomocysteinase [Catenulispora pinisilvae]|uniref:adenosylhomocysteinase n=1 Tax=Catenulispora pinisilvae TaxID=2705253 RepID=UPI001890FE54|nr:adenosylhomocysteinase [Catenulispora pinisilvae]
MKNHLQEINGLRFAVADLDLAGAGRHQIRLAEHEMPGLMALRAEYAEAQPLRGARIAGSLHMTVQTAVLIETLVAFGAEVRWVSCNIFSTQNEAAAAVVVGSEGTPEKPTGTAVFAWKGESLEEYWWCTRQLFDFGDGRGPDLLVDDGGDATLLVHLGAEYETAGSVPEPEPGDHEEHRLVLALLADSIAEDDHRFTRIAAGIRGVSEETTNGAARLYKLAREGRLLFPAINVNDSVTKSKFDNKYGIRHSMADGLNRATDVMLGGKTAVVCGYGDVGKGASEALRGQGARVVVTEIDPINALQAAMDGFQVARLEQVVATAHIFVTATAGTGAIRLEHLARMRHNAIVGNVGHFDTEIDMAGLAAHPGVTKTEIKPQVHQWTFPDGHAVLILSEGRLFNLGNATGHPSFVMSASFSNQVLAQIELFTRQEHYSDEVYRLPKQLDEKVARLHLDALGAELTELSEEQAEYLSVPIEGPYKAEHYRY